MKVGDLVKVKMEYTALDPEENPYGIIVEVRGAFAQAMWLHKGNAVLGILTLMECFEVISEA
jgi:hypothetical protein